MRRAPVAAASRASSVSCPDRSETSASPVSPKLAARCAISGQRRPVDPAAEAGLTRKTVSELMAGRGRRERDLRHAIDCGAELLVGDALELALDDDVAHRQQAAGLHAPQRSDGEEGSGFHLHGEDSAARPALVLAAVGVVEEIARDDRADTDLLLGRLRHVDRLVYQLPARRWTVRLASDKVSRRGIGGNGGERDDHVAERMVGLEAAARADAQPPLPAELDELLEDDRRAGAPHPGPLHGDRLALPGAGETEQPALAIHLRRVVQVRLGDVL